MGSNRKAYAILAENYLRSKLWRVAIHANQARIAGRAFRRQRGDCAARLQAICIWGTHGVDSGGLGPIADASAVLL